MSFLIEKGRVQHKHFLYYFLLASFQLCLLLLFSFLLLTLSVKVVNAIDNMLDDSSDESLEDAYLNWFVIMITYLIFSIIRSFQIGDFQHHW